MADEVTDAPIPVFDRTNPDPAKHHVIGSGVIRGDEITVDLKDGTRLLAYIKESSIDNFSISNEDYSAANKENN